MNNEQLKYFRHSQEFYRFIVLRYIRENEFVSLPLENADKNIEHALSQVHIQSMIDDGLLVKDKQNKLSLTELGLQKLREHFIDYQLDLLKLERELGDYFQNKIENLLNDNIKTVALYGASDTALSLLDYLKKSGINIACIIDDDQEKQGSEFEGLSIISQSELANYSIDAILITSVAFEKEIKSNIISSFGETYRMYTLLES
jgi:repressor of nif and glnA expression